MVSAIFRRRGAALAGLAALAALAAAREQPAPPLLERVEVNVVNVEVTVTAPDGSAVTGLERGDFRLREDGAPQEITNFFAIEHGRVRSTSGEEWRPIDERSPFRRRMVLLVDNNTLSRPRRDRAVDAFEEFMDASFDGSYEWAVIAVGDEVRVLQPLTTEKVLVRSALDRLRRMGSNASRYEPERNVLNDPVRVRMSQRASRSLSEQTGSGVDSGRDLATALRFESRFNMQRNLQATLRTADAMTQAFRAYGQLGGRKSMVLVTGGIEMLPQYGFQTSAADALTAPAVATDFPLEDPELYQLHSRLRDTLAAVVRAANAAQFTIYPVKATGVEIQSPQLDVAFRSSGATYSEAAFSGPAEVDDSDSGQLILADGTGGLYTTFNRVRQSFERVDGDGDAFYSLGYSPDHYGDGAYHEIAVEVVGRPELAVRARAGYVDLTDEQRLELYLASPLTFAKEKGTLPVGLELGRADGGRLSATASLPISAVGLFRQGAESMGRVYVYLAIYDTDGRLVDLVRRHQDLRFPSELEAEARRQQFRYEIRYPLDKKGRYTVTVTLRDELSGQIGTALGEVRL